MKLKKQDRTKTRTASEVETKYKLSDIAVFEKDIAQLKEDVIPDSEFSTSSRKSLENRVITVAVNKINNDINAVEENINTIIDDVEVMESNVVYKEEGKGLSTNDFTDEYKTKLDGVVLFESEDGITDTVPITGELRTYIEIDYSFRGIHNIKKVYYLTFSLESSEMSDTTYTKIIGMYNITNNIIEVLNTNIMVIDSTGTTINSATDEDKIKIHKIITY